MKKFLLLTLVLTILISCVGCGKTETTNNDSVNTNESTTETTTESTTESTTEATTETTTETTTEKQTETTTNKKVENTTTKTETTTKPSKPETTTKAPEKITENAADLSQGELLDIWRENFIDGEVVTSEEEYNYYINTYVPNYKCRYCGDHNCPAITYGPNRIGDIVVSEFDKSKCPAIKAEKIKCPNGCGRTLVDVQDDRWLTNPDKYCHGACHLNFG